MCLWHGDFKNSQFPGSAVSQLNQLNTVNAVWMLKKNDCRINQGRIQGVQPARAPPKIGKN
jgi:hypothetical protein